jgi:hypothetical protein
MTKEKPYPVPLTAEELERRSLQAQIEITKASLAPDATVLSGLVSITDLIEVFFNYLEKQMDKKMHQVSKKMEAAEKDVKKGKGKEAVKVLKHAVKKNEKLVKIDRDVRDPMIDKCKKQMKKKKGK